MMRPSVPGNPHRSEGVAPDDDAALAELRAEVASLRADVECLQDSEASLREAAERYREIADQSSDLISRHRADGEFVYASDAATTVLGYGPTELVGTFVRDLMHPDDQDAAFGVFEEAMAAGLPHATVVCRLRRKDGHYTWVESTDRFIRDEHSGEVTMFLAVTRDISARKKARDALSASEARYRTLAEQSRDLISWHGPDARYIYASSAAKSLLGYEPEELIGKGPFEFIHPDDISILMDGINAATSGGTLLAMVCRVRHKDGHYIWCESRSTMMRDPEGTITGFHGVTRDITARKALDDALRASEERYRTLAEQSHDVISRHTLDGRFIYASPSARARIGYDPEELIGHQAREFIHPDDVPSVLAALDAAAGGAPATTVVCRLRQKDGNYIWIESTDSVTRDADGTVTGFHSITRDISARKAAEDALRSSEGRFRQVFDLSHVGIAFVSENRRFLRVNQALCDMLEYSEEELLSLTFVDLTHPDDLEMIARTMRSIYDEGRDISIEKRYITKTGRIIWARINASLMPGDVTGDGTRYNLAIIEDITDRKRAEDELLNLASLKSEFLALASHELRAPLTNINGGLEVMGDDTQLLPASSRRAVQIVSAEARRLTQLVESILDISRLDAGQLPLVPGPVAIEPLIAKSIAGTEFEHRVDVWVAHGLPPAWADEVYLEQVLRNVLSNAAKYSSGRITLTACGNDDGISISIVDRGPGIAANEQSRIFEPFFRTARAHGSADGYGLGLYFARRMLEAQDGSIAVRSPASDDAFTPGTAFDICLPAAGKVS